MLIVDFVGVVRGFRGPTEDKNFRKLLGRKQSSANISRISRNTLKSSKSDIFYLLKKLLKHLLRTFSQQKGPAEVQCEFFSPNSGVNFLMWIFQPEFWGEFFDVNSWRWISWGWIFEGALFIGKHRTQKIDPRIRPKFGAQKFVSQNSTPNSGSRGAKSLCGNLPLTFSSSAEFSDLSGSKGVRIRKPCGRTCVEKNSTCVKLGLFVLLAFFPNSIPRESFKVAFNLFPCKAKQPCKVRTTWEM